MGKVALAHLSGVVWDVATHSVSSAP